MINFKASFYSHTNIQKRSPNGIYKDYKASLLELHPGSEDDYNTIRRVALKWENGNSYATDLFDVFTQEHLSESYRSVHNTRYFALCNRSNTNINPDNILGITSFSEDNDNNGSYKLKILQVNPLYKFGTALRNYRHVGKAIVNTLQNLPNLKEIKLYAVDRDAEIFYEKLNFKTLANSIFMHFKR